MFHKNIKNALFIFFWFTCLQALGYSGNLSQDMVTTRTNTLGDDADDIQKQLDNEARDRMKFGRPQTIWILHYPLKGRESRDLTTETMKLTRNYDPSNKIHDKFQGSKDNVKVNTDLDFILELSLPSPKDNWSYKDQLKWSTTYPSCGRRSQSPVNLPYRGLLHTKASRQMLFSKYDVSPRSMTLTRDGETISLTGDWGSELPFVYGGAAHSRRYVFHSLAIRRPSEHTVGGLTYPLETQAVHVSAEYATLQDAVQAAPRDKSALLIVANIYRHANENHNSLEALVRAINKNTDEFLVTTPFTPTPLRDLSPPLKEYAAYFGSQTTPPCAETVLWLVRAKPLPITRELVEVVEEKSSSEGFRRLVQPLNDRNIYYFN